MYIFGFVFLGFLFFMALASLSCSIHHRSHYKPEIRLKKQPPYVKSRAVVSFSTLLPFVALSFVSLIFPAMKIIKAQGAEGHLDYLVIALLVPTGCFLLGYYYFKKMVRP